jgi:hypothetical protein
VVGAEVALAVVAGGIMIAQWTTNPENLFPIHLKIKTIEVDKITSTPVLKTTSRSSSKTTSTPD